MMSSTCFVMPVVAATALIITLASPRSLCAETLPKVSLVRLAEGFVSPVSLVPLPGSTDLAVVDQAGIVTVIDAAGNRRNRPLLDVRSKMTKLNGGFDERGLLSIAFHPRFSEKPLVYAYYSAPLQEGAPEDWDHTSHVSSFAVTEWKADLASENVLLRINQPQFNHNSGCLVFGQDGHLFISTGDGGAGSDSGKGHVKGGNAQDIEQLLGKILRINVDGKAPYTSPKDNPFVGVPGRDEIFAWGVRNPWGVVLDPNSPKQLIIADVGQDRYAEVNIIKRGHNYGWHLCEGFEGFDPKKPRATDVKKPRKDKFGNPLTDPVLVYKNIKHTEFKDDSDAVGSSITGGVVHAGDSIPELKGKYIFGDWSQQWTPAKGSLLVADRSGNKWSMQPLRTVKHPDGLIDAYVTGFGNDTQGETYVLTSGQPGLGAVKGIVWKLSPAN